MMDLYFFLKTLLLTLALVLVLQMKVVGDQTLEDQAMMVFHSSVVEQSLSKVAQGGAKIARNLINFAQEKINGKKDEKKNQTSQEKKKSGFRFIWDSK